MPAAEGWPASVERSPAVSTTAVGAVSSSAASAAVGIGDPYFPHDGNPGYQVRHYDIDVRYRPATRLLAGTTTIRLVPKRRLSSFSLDLLLHARRVAINGTRVRFSQTQHELTVRPRRPLAAAKAVDVQVTYRGRPVGLRYNGEAPLKKTRTGAIALGEPHVAAWWYPSNDHPSDKARFDITLRVPRGFEAISNGGLLGHRDRGETSVWRWSVGKPMTTYLAFAAFGQYRIEHGQTASGKGFLYAVEKGLRPSTAKAAWRSLRLTGEITRWLERSWGRYPYRQIGGVVPNTSLGFALENQTRPVYSPYFFGYGVSRSIIVHEMAHQWFGDRVAVKRWKHIWLNEGPATYAEWMWESHRGGRTPQRQFLNTYRSFEPSSAFWKLPIGDPGSNRIFDEAVYVRGAMVIQALRNRVGDCDFFSIMRHWVHANADGLGGTHEFKVRAERISGEQLDSLFRSWLLSGKKPPPTALNGLP